jgi:hypothetical protein
MDLLRKLIIEKTRSGTSFWALDVYHYLIGHGASHADALKAMNLFVDEAIAAKTHKSRYRELCDLLPPHQPGGSPLTAICDQDGNIITRQSDE